MFILAYHLIMSTSSVFIPHLPGTTVNTTRKVNEHLMGHFDLNRLEFFIRIHVVFVSGKSHSVKSSRKRPNGCPLTDDENQHTRR